VEERPSASRRLAQPIGIFVALTILLTWPQALHPSAVPNHQDAWFNLWRLAWVAHQLPRDPAGLFDANIFWPESNALALSDATLLQALLAAPGLWLGMPTPVAYTALVLASFVFAGVSAFLLAHHVTGSRRGALIAGVVFAFTAYRFDHYMHLELLWAGWMPLVLLAIHRTFESGRVRSGLAAGALFAAQTWASIYYGVLLTAVLAAMTPVMAWSHTSAAVRRAAPALAAGALVASVLVLPYLQPYLDVRASFGERSHADTQLYGAGLRHYLASTPESLVYGRLTADWGRPEKRLFPGLVAIALAGIALWRPVPRTRLAYLVGLLVAADLSAGHAGLLFPVLRDHVLPFRGLRVPARAGEIVMLMTAVLAGAGWARLETRFPSRRASGYATALAIAVMLLEYAQAPMRLHEVPTRPAQVHAWLAGEPTGAVLELPLPSVREWPRQDVQYQYFSTFHWQPLVNGYSGYMPDSYVRMLAAMQSFPSDVSVAWLRASKVRLVVLHEALWEQEAYRSTTEALAGHPAFLSRAVFGTSGSEVRVFEVRRASDE
jgi:hypothetical protein